MYVVRTHPLSEILALLNHSVAFLQVVVRAHLSHIFHTHGNMPWSSKVDISKHNRFQLLGAFDALHEINYWKNVSARDFPLRTDMHQGVRLRRNRIDLNDDSDIEAFLDSDIESHGSLREDENESVNGTIDDDVTTNAEDSDDQS
jgi:hypothetical protein